MQLTQYAVIDVSYAR